MKTKFISTTVLYIVLFLVTSSLFGQVRQKFDVRMPMRNGTELSADIWLPENEGKYPAILVRTPYTKADRQPRFPEFGKFFAERGYVFIVQDVLVYTTEVLKESIEIIGEVSVNLYASSDALDTHFTTRLLDVYPEGRAINLGAEPGGGIIRARYRNGYEKEEFLVPNKPELFNIKLFYMGHTFLAGHSIRVEISSSATTDYFPNQNTGNPVATDTAWEIANQTKYHDKTRSSHIILPIMTNSQ